MMFLTDRELVTLTGFIKPKLQVKQLAKMGLVFFVNATGKPVVPISSVQGNISNSKPKDKEQGPIKAWVPNVLLKK